MKPRVSLLVVLAFALVCIGFSKPGAADPPRAKEVFKKDMAPFLAKNCFGCHGNGKARGDLTLDKYQTDEAVQKDAKVWENVAHMVRTGQMPPKEKPRPPVKDVEAFLSAVDGLLNAMDCSGVHNVGRVTLHRLNRNEYNNTIRDLIGVDFKPAADFPNDDSGYGFDNIGDVLSLSPLLLERYLAAADSILDQAIVIADPPKPTKMRLPGLRVSRGAGEVKRGIATVKGKGVATGESYLDEGDYIIRATVYGEQLGNEPVKAALRIGRSDVKEFEIKAVQSKPMVFETKTNFKRGTAQIGVSFLNPTAEPKAAEMPAEKGKARETQPKAADKQATGDKSKDRETPAKLADKQGTADKGKARDSQAKSVDQQAKSAETKKERQLVVQSIEVEGPFNPPPMKLPASHERLMAHKPGQPPREAAREIVTRFATQAFRRPVQAAEVERSLALYDKAEKEGERFEDRVRLALARVLVSPSFLFRVELDPPAAKAGESYRINEFELASRLSYFFWSSMPDQELFDLAARGQLRPNLRGQIKRLLKDPKSAAFFQNFPGQWLTLRSLAQVSPDPKLFPRFDNDLRDAMVRESEMFFEAIVREDRSILDLLDADFSFVNEKLAQHYGLTGVKGKEFRRVKLPPNRGGILTQASILTLTSNSTRTSPVKRGKWVLDQVLSTPPPPPPPDVPPLPEGGELKGTLRKMMEQHRENALCASCHSRMDPIGFAFENYDAVGAWRDKEGAFAIDASGILPSGQSFNGPGELKAILKEKKDLFSRALAEKLLTYALGRGLEYYDKCALDTIVAELAKNDYRFSTLLEAVVLSEPFQMRTAVGEKR
jgi:Protein of unknown function (DUF1592)/Protein of unknown function (DUF1588)/Protein of unknown function (DUF1585)/Protein of unknown function (DUF1587)/Protein of unknown function (DUF1595)/Planctomycete cytochrome C